MGRVICNIKKQDFKCAYTGDEIVLGLNDSVDHKLPLSLYPSEYNNIENLQWVTREVNTMKRNLTEEHFFDIISRIYNKCLNK